LWLVEYGHLPAYHEGYALLIPGGLLLMLAVAFIGDVFNL